MLMKKFSARTCKNEICTSYNLNMPQNNFKKPFVEQKQPIEYLSGWGDREMREEQRWVTSRHAPV